MIACTKIAKILDKELNSLARKLLKDESGVALSFASRHEISFLNRRYRNKTKSTDILSFPSTVCHHELEQHFLHDSEILLGQIVVCPEVISRRLGDSIGSESVLKMRLRRLLVHGVAHLFHHDHQTWAGYTQMRKFERWLLGKYY